jgi:PAS domain S-box-containing protein
MTSTAPAPAAPETDEAERRRLARLRMLAVLDTDPEPVFDALVRIAAAVCGMPIALISLVDEDRQWFKANEGLAGVHQTPREIAFCDHAIRGEALFEVRDATLDQRFSANPLVTGDPGIRFYAGAPIAMPSGERIGTLCVIDRRPGVLSPQQQAALLDLAQVAQWALLQRERLQEGREAEHQQRTAHELLASVVAHLPCGLAVFDGELRLIGHNREYEQLLDLPPHLFARPDLRLPELVRFTAIRGDYGAGDVEAIVDQTVRRARSGVSQHFQRELPGGRTLNIRGAPLPGGGFVATFVDITPARTVEQALRASEERQKRALDASRLALWDLDLRTGQLYLSENWSLFLGGPPVPTVTTLPAVLDLVPAEERQALQQALVAAMRGDSDRYAMDHRVRRLDGSWLWVHSEGRMTERDAEGQALHATGTNQDITLRRAAEAEAARAAAITTATLEATTDAILVVGAGREILLYNRHFLDVWNLDAPPDGLRHEELAPQAGAQLKEPHSYLTRLREVYAAPERESRDLLEFDDGRLFERSARPMALPDGTIGRVWSYRDITAQRAADAQVRRAKEAAEAANRAKSDFLDNVSHEIRTPLNGVLGLTRLLLAEPLTPQQRKYVQLAEHSASSLLELINDLLDLGKIESGRMDLEELPFRLDELLQHLGDLYRLRAAEKDLQFVLEVAAEVPVAVRGDAGRLRQILNNLLSNALKFSGEDGQFGLTVARTPPGRGELLVFTVWDRGIGIPHDVQQRLFTRFTQADSSTSRKFGGTGLGLAIVKQLCEQMGGGVTLQSAPGRGASFRCELPLAALAPEAVAASSPAPADAPVTAFATRLLVAEDNPTNQVVVRGLLAQAGYHDVTIVGDGQEALDVAPGGDFDLVLMDCRMPRMDGYEAARRLRACGFTPPIIALTANASAGERDRCLAWGMNEYLAKPIDPQRLAQVLAEWTGNDASASASASARRTNGSPVRAFDRAHALQGLGGDEELLAIALASFRQQLPRLLRAASEALDAGAVADLHRHLHSLAGSSSMVGGVSLHQLAQELEADAGEGRLDVVREGLPALRELCERFLREST